MRILLEPLHYLRQLAKQVCGIHCNFPGVPKNVFGELCGDIHKSLGFAEFVKHVIGFKAQTDLADGLIG